MGLVEVLSELDGYRLLLRKKGQLWSFLQRLNCDEDWSAQRRLTLRLWRRSGGGGDPPPLTGGKRRGRSNQKRRTGKFSRLCMIQISYSPSGIKRYQVHCKMMMMVSMKPVLSICLNH